MAWQEPRITWTAADGVRDTDFNRIEGNTLELYNETARETRTIYVNASTGNDTTGVGSASAPYATITKALAMAPKNLNGKTCTIQIAPGTYNENVVVAGSRNGIVTFASNAFNSAVTIQGITVENCGALEIKDMALYMLGTILVRRNSSLISTANIIHQGRGTALEAAFNSMAQIFEITISDTFPTQTGIQANSNSRVAVSSIKGAASNYTLYASGGGVIAYNNNTATGPLYTASGGRLYTGSQV